MTKTSILQIHQGPLPGGPTGAGGGRVAACADTVSAAPTSQPGGVLSHVYRLPLRVPWTGQPGHTTGLEQLGFYGDTLAALRAGLLRQLCLPLRGVWALTSSELPWAVPDGPT